LRTDGIGPFGFGSKAGEVDAWLIDQFGSPDAATVEIGPGGWPLMSCMERRFAYWASAGLTVGFTDLNSVDASGLPDCDNAPHLAGWYVITDEVPWFAHGTNIPLAYTLRLTTAQGIGLGSLAGDLREAYPTATFGEQGIDTYSPVSFRATDTMWGRVAWDPTSDIQKALNEHGAILVVDGIFGPNTEAALVEFQTSHGITENGTVGPRTLAELHVSVPDDAPIVYLAAGTWDWDY
jgi:peptidoglycan hydrolase-like protein with peptidoglycan-binding domain